MEKQHKNIEELETGSIKRVIWKFFLPSFAGVMINSLYNIVDRIFIGQGVGPIALSALSAVFPIMLIIMGFGMLVGIGAGVRVSINLGLKDFARAEKVLGNATVLLVIISVIIATTGFIIKGPMLRLFGVGEDTYTYANDYLNIILFGTMFGMMGFALNNIIRSEGNARIAMYSMLISAGMNIILDPIFIFGLHMGVKGAAWATIISQFALLIWVLLHFTNARSVIKLRMSNFKPDRRIIWYIFSIGFSPFSMQIAASMVHGMLNTQLVKYGGDIAVGAMGIVNSYAMLVIMSIIAINMAAQPLISFNFGAGNFIRVKKTLVLCLKAGTFISIAGFLFAQIFPHIIVKAFNKDSQDLFDMGKQGLHLFFAAFSVVGFQIITSNYFQSTGNVIYAISLSLLRQVIVLIPVLWILPGYLNLTGVWLASPIADVISAIICALVLTMEFKKINNRIALTA